MEKCPTCNQNIPPPPEPVKVCFDCQKQIERAHKWQYKQILVGISQQKATVMAHRHCDNPQSYLSKEGKRHAK